MKTLFLSLEKFSYSCRIICFSSRLTNSKQFFSRMLISSLLAASHSLICHWAFSSMNQFMNVPDGICKMRSSCQSGVKCGHVLGMGTILQGRASVCNVYIRLTDMILISFESMFYRFYFFFFFLRI